MSSEYGPHCRSARRRLRRDHQPPRDLPDGSVRPVRTRSYHCATRRGFIRREEVDAGRPCS